MRVKKESKRVLFDTEITNEYLLWAEENLKECGAELTEDDIQEEAETIKQYEYEDLMEAFDTINTKGNIIAIADCGLWNGRKTGYKILGHNLGEIVNILNNYDDIEIFIDDKNLRAVAHHHDGTNYILFRSFKEHITEEQQDDFVSLLFSSEGANNYQMGHYTESIKPLIVDYYGF